MTDRYGSDYDDQRWAAWGTNEDQDGRRGRRSAPADRSEQWPPQEQEQRDPGGGYDTRRYGTRGQEVRGYGDRTYPEAGYDTGGYGNNGYGGGNGGYSGGNGYQDNAQGSQGYPTGGHDAGGYPGAAYGGGQSGAGDHDRSRDWFGGSDETPEPEPPEPRLFRADYQRPGPSGYDQPGPGRGEADRPRFDRGGFDPPGVGDDPYEHMFAPEPRGTPDDPGAPAGPGGSPGPDAAGTEVREPRPGGRAASRAAQRPAEADDDGLGAGAAFLLGLGVSTVCAIAGAAVLGSVGLVFAVGFVLATVYVALRIRRQDLLWAVIVPPIAFGVALVASTFFADDTDTSSSLLQRLVDFSTVLAGEAPLLLGCEAAAIVIALVRRVRSGRRP